MQAKIEAVSKLRQNEEAPAEASFGVMIEGKWKNLAWRDTEEAEALHKIVQKGKIYEVVMDGNFITAISEPKEFSTAKQAAQAPAKAVDKATSSSQELFDKAFKQRKKEIAADLDWALNVYNTSGKVFKDEQAAQDLITSLYMDIRQERRNIKSAIERGIAP